MTSNLRFTKIQKVIWKAQANNNPHLHLKKDKISIDKIILKTRYPLLNQSLTNKRSMKLDLEAKTNLLIMSQILYKKVAMDKELKELAVNLSL